MTKARENSDYTGLQGDLALKSPVASPVFTGNVGVGVTPESTWHSTHTVLQLGDRGALIDDAGGITMMSNSYYDSGWKYLNTDLATNYESKSGTHKFQVAPSGTADAAISWNTAMTIDNAGIVTKPLQPSFRVGSTAGFSAGTNMTHNTTYHNIGNHYNSSNGRFTAPVAGVYFLGMQGISGSSTASSEQNTRFIKNGSTFITDNRTRGYTEGSYHLQTVLELAANDYVIVNQDAGTTYASAQHNQFMGYLIG